MLKNISLVLFVALVAAGCAPKSTRKPITPGGTQSGQTPGGAAGAQGGNGKPEPRETNPDPTRQGPETQPSTTPSAVPPVTPQTEPPVTPPASPQTQPSSTPPSSTPTVAQPQVGPPNPQQGGGQAQSTAPQQGGGPVTPAQTLAQITAPSSPAPELESKPGLSPYLWMRLHGNGDTEFEVEMNIVATPPLKEDRSNDKLENARFLNYDFKITNFDGASTQGHFQFRHPHHGAIEKFNVTDPTKEAADEKLKEATEATKKAPKPFEIQIRIPINEVTEEMLFTAAESFRDFAARDRKYEEEWRAVTSDDPAPAQSQSETDGLRNEIRKLKAQIQVLNGITEDKRADSQIRLAINKYQLAEHMLKPAFKRWGEIFLDKDCDEALDPKNSKPPGCHGKIWVRQKRLVDIKEFYRYLDRQGAPEQLATAERPAVAAVQSTADRLVDEYLKAESARKAEERRQALVSQPAQPGGAIPPMAPPPPAPSTALDFAIGEVKILTTNGEPSGGALTQPNRIKLVFVGDAFTKAQGPTFYVEAQKKWDFLFGSTAANQPGVEPFRTYRKYFMGIAIATESTDGKSCHPSQGHDCRTGASRTVKTALESQFDNFGIQRLLGMSKEGYRKLGNLLRANVPDFDLASVIVNDPEYGGAGGTYALVSLDPNANEVIAHELMGHSFAKLGDEYTDPYPSFPDTEESNTMKDSTKAEGKKWASHMLKNKSDLATTAPADESEFIQEVVQGSHYHNDGWWRPFRMCKMKVLGKPFCSVCRDGIIQKIYNKIKPIDTITTTPALNDKGALAVKASDAWEAKISTLQPEQPTTANASTPLLKIEWLLSADKECKQTTPIAGAAGDTLTAATAKLNPGNYTVCAKVTDTNIDVTRLKLELGAPSPLEQVRAFKLRIN